ncbi:hypothetical protein HDV06_004097 [Boothiomyces sp. JEL0866]|nr:hypothetical protein HDV06_004097 [Boothiomyces sp. JEL0866]
MVQFHTATNGSSVEIDAKAYDDYKKLRNDVFAALDITEDYYFKYGNSICQDLTSIQIATDVIQVLPIKHAQGPPTTPILGNIPDMLFGPGPEANLKRIFQEYGPVVKLFTFATEQRLVSDPTDAEVVARESEYFTKEIRFPFSVTKSLGGDGLFTSSTSDPHWELAHKLLMPTFSPKAIKNYTNEIFNITIALKKIFDTFAKDGTHVPLNHHMTNVTFESIGRVGFGYSFHVLDSPDAKSHPFLEAMGYCLGELINRMLTPDFVKAMPLPSNRKFNNSIALMRKTVDEVISARKSKPKSEKDNKDLLDFMLTAADEHGEKMPDGLIRDQVITFLIAGHDTTSNTLTWAIWLLHQNPNWLKKVQDEVDSLNWSLETPELMDISKLNVVERVLKETLRMHPPVQRITKVCKKDTVLPSGYFVPGNTNCAISANALHNNPDVYPEPQTFNPDRWLPEEESKRSPFSWLPFSIGARGCIGRQFAMLEAKIVLATIVRYYHFLIPGAENVKPLTTSAIRKATPFNIKFFHREVGTAPPKMEDLKETGSTPSLSPTKIGAVSKSVGKRVPVSVLFGSNTGTSMDYAEQVSNIYKDMGFTVLTKPLNDWAPVKQGAYEPLPGQDLIRELVVIVTATYNGNPPENAELFDKFMNKMTLAKSSLSGIGYSVFGCGNSEWRTYQAFPMKINNVFEELGAYKINPRGEANAKVGDMDTSFEYWVAALWTMTVTKFGLQVEQVPRTTEDVTYDDAKVECVETSEQAKNYLVKARNAKVLSTTEEQDPRATGRSTKNILLSLPEGQSYLPGDHLEVYPIQDPSIVRDFAAITGIDLDRAFEIKEFSNRVSSRSLLASVKGPFTFRALLSAAADLTSPPTRTILKVFGDALQKDPATEELGKKFVEMSAPDGKQAFSEFLKEHRTIFDFFKHYGQHAKKLELKDWLACIQIVQPRRYSISTSPKQGNVVGVLIAEHVDEINKKKYYGLASHYMCNLKVNDQVSIHVKSCKDTFRLPENSSIPVIMIGAGTGLAPFLGFLEDRKLNNLKSISMGGNATTHLIFGCRNEGDTLLQKQMNKYVNEGILDGYHLALSRPATGSKKYVQDIIWDQKDLFYDLVKNKSAKIYVCGSGTMSKGVKESFERTFEHFKDGKTYFENVVKESRFSEDTWG